MTGNTETEVKNNYQKIVEENRRRNKQMQEEALAEFYKLYPDMKDDDERVRKERQLELQKHRLKQTPKRTNKRTKSDDPSFRVASHRVQRGPTRRSARLSKSDVEYKENDDIGSDDDNQKPKKRQRLTEYDDPDSRPPKRRSYSQLGSRAFQVPELPVETVDDKLLSKIAYKSRKVYCSVNGTTCHQCRQKTTDTKSVCRSGTCVGVRGMFCGVCLRNRYGEDVAEVLKDPNWSCPPCRGDCNCSICRTREGKTPTGIMVPFIREKGYRNLREYLNKNPEDDEL